MWEKMCQSTFVNNFLVRGLLLAGIILLMIIAFLTGQDGNVTFVYNNF